MPQKIPAFNAAYFIGLAASLISVALILLTLYMLPALLFGLKYAIPGFLILLREYFVSQLAVTETSAAVILILIFVFLIIIFGYVAYRFENQIEQQAIFEETGEKPEVNVSEEQNVPVVTDVDRGVKPSPHFAGKMLLWTILIILGLFCFQWLIST